jgi:hypothetical protein
MALRMEYAGIGAVETPSDVIMMMRYLAALLLRKGFTLRSGGAKGADKAFETGAAMNGFAAVDKMRIFTAADAGRHPEWFHHARQFHPAWRLCSDHAQALHARNSPIILGETLNDPVDFVLCWTRGGKIVGGTGQGLRIAAHHRIPVVNLYNDPQASALFLWLAENQLMEGGL